MARKKGTVIGEESRKISDGRFKDPQDARIQEKNLEKTLERLRKGSKGLI
jgi:hypothetical protein